MPASSSVRPPVELADAVVTWAAEPVALKATSPVAPRMSRSVVARVMSLTSAMPTAAPMDALSPAALPLALVAVVFDCVADSVTPPEPCSAAPVPRRAVVVLLSIANASDGVIAMPPDAPASASVVAACTPWASSDTAPLPASVAPSAISAVLWLPVMLTAADAPMPALPPVAPSSTGVARAVMSVPLTAVSATAPVPASTTAPLRTSASLRVSIRFSASEPAMPTLLPPAPDAASASTVCVWSPATSVMDASMTSPFDCTTAWLPTAATVLVCTWLSATAAPIPNCVPLPTAAPSALAAASVLPLAARPTAPVVDTVRPSAMVAVLRVSTRLTATAAATDTLPSLVLADALPPAASPVDACCLVLPTPLRDCCVLPCVSWLPTLSSTDASSCFLPLASVWPASSSGLPPVELALAVVVWSDEDAALKLTSPVAARMSRSVVATVTSLTSAMPTAAPTDAVSPAALPLTVVTVVFDCVADSATPPAPCSAAPVPRRAVVVLLTIASASAGVMAMPPDAPASASVVVLCAARASSDTAPLPVSVAPSEISAVLWLPTMFTAAEAPMPSLPPAAPSSTGAALAAMSVLFSATSATAPAPASTAAPLRTRASLRVSIRFSASEPAMPTLLPPAPDAASDCTVCVTSPATSVMPAVSDRPSERITAALPMDASATDASLLIDTAAPMPTCVVLPSVLPSASALGSALPSVTTLASVLFDAASVTVPAAVTSTGTSARAVAFCRFTPTAAATEILPSLVLAEPSPSFCACTLLSVDARCLLSPTRLADCFFLPTAICLPTLSSTLASSAGAAVPVPVPAPVPPAPEPVPVPPVPPAPPPASASAA